MTSSIFDSKRENQWCPGCGNFGILAAMKQAFENQNLTPKDLLMVGGIGQGGKTPHYLSCNMLHGLHGRALAMATGAKTANHNLKVVVSSGDGDCYGEGGNHFLAAIRRNVDLTLLVHNNQVYGLTKGQASPTTALGAPARLQKNGAVSRPFNPIAAALVTGATFVAKGFSGNQDQLVHMITEAMNHKGFAMIDIYQPCVSFNKLNTHLWYKERVYDLAETGHDASDFKAALDIAVTEDDGRIPTGIIYQAESVAFHERLSALKNGPLSEYPFDEKQMSGILP